MFVQSCGKVSTSGQGLHRTTALSQSRSLTATSARSFKASDFVRPHILDLAPYKPIFPLEVISDQLGIPVQRIIKLDANENPYGPPPEVFKVLANVEFPQIYPDPESRFLRAKLAAECGIPAENILVGCGADELIDLILRVVLEPDDVVLNTPPTFGMYSFDCLVNGGKVVDIPRSDGPGFDIDVAAIRTAVLAHRAKVLFLTSPNNPDGTVIKPADLAELLELPVLVVLDEAYIEFCEIQESRMRDVLKRENLIVLRTFSKRAALAGLRVGYCAAPLWLMDYLWRVKQPYNVSIVAELAACAALDNPKYLQDVKDMLIQERQRLLSKLEEFDFLNPYASHSNFLLVKVDGDAEKLKDYLASKGIMVRYYSGPPQLASCIRISVGKPEHTDALVLALSTYVA
jgi:histidinol-phosphate aminotransferase